MSWPTLYMGLNLSNLSKKATNMSQVVVENNVKIKFTVKVLKCDTTPRNLRNIPSTRKSTGSAQSSTKQLISSHIFYCCRS